MAIKISDLVKNFKINQEGVTEDQIFDCYNNPELKGNAFDSDIFAKQLGEKALIIVVRGDSVIIDVVFTKLANKLSYYDNAGDLYRVAFTATGDESFYKSTDNGGAEVWGKVNKGNKREEE